MSKRRGPKAKATIRQVGVAPLKSMNIMLDGHRTSMRLEPSMWTALEEIAGRERMSVNDVCSRIKNRLEEQNRRKGTTADSSDVTLTSAVRTFIVSYFRNAQTEDGHSRAGHGRGGDPFVGTPFELPPDDDGDASSGTGGPTGNGSEVSGSIKPPGSSGRAATGLEA
ncbi:ribbon-helix-helix domain-containing protein [Azospirillum oleiclasticum]|nr:ribbon-helix-helix domain-containing protein [Azospirillum oleiclasticum]